MWGLWLLASSTWMVVEEGRMVLAWASWTAGENYAARLAWGLSGEGGRGGTYGSGAEERDGALVAAYSEEIAVRAPLDAFDAEAHEVVVEVVPSVASVQLTVRSVDIDLVSRGRRIPHRQPSPIRAPLQTLRIHSRQRERPHQRIRPSRMQRDHVLGRRSRQQRKDARPPRATPPMPLCRKL